MPSNIGLPFAFEVFMPFNSQCPHDACRKFMLLEDEVQGGVVDCLACKNPIQLDAGGGPAQEDEIIDLQPVSERIPKNESAAFQVRNCPKCGHPLRVPRGEEKKAQQCTECDFWGLV